MKSTGARRRALVSWSSGKDSAWCLTKLGELGLEAAALLTTFNREFDRVAMHGVRRSLVEAQARAAGLPLWAVDLPWPCSNERYEQCMAEACRRAVACGLDCVVFGDLFLADIREYRERQLRGTGLEPVFPLWGLPTAALAREMIAGGLRARITCVDPKALPRSFAGREFDAAFLDALPAATDPCGENGEFHSFVYAGPMFSGPLDLGAGDVVERDGFVFADLCCASSH